MKETILKNQLNIIRLVKDLFGDNYKKIKDDVDYHVSDWAENIYDNAFADLQFDIGNYELEFEINSYRDEDLSINPKITVKDWINVDENENYKESKMTIKEVKELITKEYQN